jgi:hypothetical protein
MSTAVPFRRLWLAVLAAVPAALGCTAVGAWIYDDPSIALRSAQLHPRGDVDGMSDSLELVFVACNRNDYEVRGEGFETRLAVAGRMVGTAVRDYPLYMGTRDTARFTVTVPLHDFDTTRGPSQQFEVTAHGQLFTPMGSRPLALHLHGRVLATKDQLVWREEGTVPCRPGLSVLPNQFDEPSMIRPPRGDRPPTGGQPGGQPGGGNSPGDRP